MSVQISSTPISGRFAKFSAALVSGAVVCAVAAGAYTSATGGTTWDAPSVVAAGTTWDADGTTDGTTWDAPPVVANGTTWD
ncbi:hypothetical protein ACFHYQ_25720 [Sphaerimonospora cavernae]|uniref:Uncharacterized protein n=1 Tax=Sphaerimonospora cavernae TaxID=1740611 RepID=A0ABV6UBY0_9ACTN